MTLVQSVGIIIIVQFCSCLSQIWSLIATYNCAHLTPLKAYAFAYPRTPSPPRPPCTQTMRPSSPQRLTSWASDGGVPPHFLAQMLCDWDHPLIRRLPGIRWAVCGHKRIQSSLVSMAVSNNPLVVCSGELVQSTRQRHGPSGLEIHFGIKSYIHASHCAFCGLWEHKVELFRGPLKGLFYIFYAEKANERGTKSIQRTDSI